MKREWKNLCSGSHTSFSHSQTRWSGKKSFTLHHDTGDEGVELSLNYKLQPTKSNCWEDLNYLVNGMGSTPHPMDRDEQWLGKELNTEFGFHLMIKAKLAFQENAGKGTYSKTCITGLQDLLCATTIFYDSGMVIFWDLIFWDEGLERIIRCSSVLPVVAMG